MKRLLTLLLLLAPSVLAQNPTSGGPIPQTTYTTPSYITPTGLPTGCTSPGTGAITCTNAITAGSFVTSGTGAAYTQWTTAALPVSAAGTVLCGANSGNIFSCSDDAGAVSSLPFIAGDIGGTQSSPQIVGLHLTAEGYTGNQALTFICTNDTVTGPTNNLLALQTSTGCIKATTGNTNVPLTITFSGGATSGSSHQVYSGIGSCIMDATTASTQGFYVIASVLVAGRCHAQSAQPSGVYIIGIMNDNATTIAVAGNVEVGGSYGLPAPGSSAFSALTSSTNTTAAMICDTGCTFASTAEVDLGKAGTNGVLGLLGTTSGTAKFTAPAIAGTTTNGVTMTNVLLGPNGTNAAPTYSFSGQPALGMYSRGSDFIDFSQSGTKVLVEFSSGINPQAIKIPNNAAFAWTNTTDQATNAAATGLSVEGPGIIDIGNGTVGDVTGTLKGASFLSAPTTHAITMPVTIGSGTSIGSTILCAAADCPAGTYAIPTYIDITTACGTTGTYLVNLIYTDDQGAKTVVVNINGTGSVPATGTLTTTSTANFGENYQVIRVASGNINYSTTATACGSAGPMVGKLYMVANRVM